MLSFLDDHFAGKMSPIILRLVLTSFACLTPVLGNEASKRLYEDLLFSYNKLTRPVLNASEPVKVKFKLKLAQLLDVEWYDHKLSWRPAEYENVTMIYVPGNMIWLPDIVLYNNADGKYQVTIATKAAVHYSGRVRWEPPAIYKSMCQIDVEWFPFDDQVCTMKFGSWSYDGQEVDLTHSFFEDHEEFNQPVYKYTNGNITIECLENGIDLSRYYSSTEWDIIAVPSVKKHEKYPCCPNKYIDITYHLHLRRKPLFYAVNLIFPCMGMSFLTMAVFYLPSSSGEKVTLCISILVSLTVFFLLLVEIIPSTSLVVPLMAKYLLFTMVTITVAIAVTVLVINVHFRSHRTHSLSEKSRKLLLESKLAKYLLLDDPKQLLGSPVKNLSFSSKKPNFRPDRQTSSMVRPPVQFFNCNFEEFLQSSIPTTPKTTRKMKGRIGGGKFSLSGEASGLGSSSTTPLIRQKNVAARICETASQLMGNDGDRESQLNMVVDELIYIATCMEDAEHAKKIVDEWKFVSMIIDRIFLIVFAVTCFAGSAIIILQAPYLYDQREAIDRVNATIKTDFCRTLEL